MQVRVYYNLRKKEVRLLFKKNEFKAEVVRRDKTLEDVARAIGIDIATLHRKMNGVSDFNRSEIEKVIKFLNLTNEEILRIFFAD